MISSPKARFLDQVVGEVATARKRAAESAQMRDHRRKLFLELGVRQRNRLGRSFGWSVLFAIVCQPRPHPLPARDRGHARFDPT
jgi:hypothetical protein